MKYQRTQTATLVSDLLAVGITLPAEITDIIKKAEAHDKRRPPQVGHPDLVDAYLDGATDKKLATLATDALATEVLNKAWASAGEKFGARVRQALDAHALGAIIPQLAERAAPLIAELEALAAFPTTDTAALIRAGREDDARIAARARVTSGDLARLFNLRERVTRHADYGAQTAGIDCSTWREPSNVRQHNNVHDTLLDGIRRKGGLWFPTPDEAQRRAREIKAARKAARKAEQVQAAKRGVLFF